MRRATWCSDRTFGLWQTSFRTGSGCWTVLAVGGLLLFTAALHADSADKSDANREPRDPASQTAPGRTPVPKEPSAPPLSVGQVVPTTTMRCVFGAVDDRNTCLAGVHGKRQAFSIYVRSVDDPHLSRFVQQLDRKLASNADDQADDQADVRAYVVVIGPSQFDEGAKRELRDWARRLELRQTDVAISVADSKRDFGFFPETKALVVFADRKQVRERHSFGPDDWNAESAERLLAECVRRLP